MSGEYRPCLHLLFSSRSVQSQIRSRCGCCVELKGPRALSRFHRSGQETRCPALTPVLTVRLQGTSTPSLPECCVTSGLRYPGLNWEEATEWEELKHTRYTNSVRGQCLLTVLKLDWSSEAHSIWFFPQKTLNKKQKKELKHALKNTKLFFVFCEWILRFVIFEGFSGRGQQGHCNLEKNMQIESCCVDWMCSICFVAFVIQGLCVVDFTLFLYLRTVAVCLCI